MLRFEWDPEKAGVNVEKHGISFEDAATVFSDPLADTFPDIDHLENEDRYITIGISSKGTILVVVFTEKNSIIRIITARRATNMERRYYENG